MAHRHAYLRERRAGDTWSGQCWLGGPADSLRLGMEPTTNSGCRDAGRPRAHVVRQTRFGMVRLQCRGSPSADRWPRAMHPPPPPPDRGRCVPRKVEMELLFHWASCPAGHQRFRGLDSAAMQASRNRPNGKPLPRRTCMYICAVLAIPPCRRAAEMSVAGEPHKSWFGTRIPSVMIRHSLLRAPSMRSESRASLSPVHRGRFPPSGHSWSVAVVSAGGGYERRMAAVTLRGHVSYRSYRRRREALLGPRGHYLVYPDRRPIFFS